MGAIAVNPLTNMIYVGNIFAGNIIVIDGISDKIVDEFSLIENMTKDSLDLEKKITNMAVNPLTNKLYVDRGDSDLISVVNTISKKVISNIPLDDYYYPNKNHEVTEVSGHELVINSETNRVYVGIGSANRLMVIDGNDDNIHIVD